MSLAYAEGKDGKLQVAYEAMDKISIFKDGYWWRMYCPCHAMTSSSLTFTRAIYHCKQHLRNWHPDDD